MNTIGEYILEKGSHLYRYDIVEPPKDWSTVFKNPQYANPDIGVKNQIGAFFFFSSCCFATMIGECALEDEKK